MALPSSVLVAAPLGTLRGLVTDREGAAIADSHVLVHYDAAALDRATRMRLDPLVEKAIAERFE